MSNQENPQFDLTIIYELPLEMTCQAPLAKLIERELLEIYVNASCLSNSPPEYQYLISVKPEFLPMGSTNFIKTQFRVSNNQNQFLGHVSFVANNVLPSERYATFKQHFKKFKTWLTKHPERIANIDPRSYHILDAVKKDLPDDTLYHTVGPAIYSMESLVDQKILGDSGTAFLIHNSGLFLTAAHVAEHLFNDRVEYFATSAYVGPQIAVPQVATRTGMKVVGLNIDTWSDLALFTVENHDEISFLNALTLSNPKAPLNIGDELLSMGYSQESWPFTTTKGIVSGYKPKFGKVLTQVSSDLDSGMSGGPTISANNHQVVGLNVLKDSHSTIGWVVGMETINHFLFNSMTYLCDIKNDQKWCTTLKELLGQPQ